MVTGKIEEFTFKEGEGDKGKWIKYGIKLGGVWYGTFSETIGNAADSFHQADQAVTLTWRQDGQYRTVVNLEEAAK